MKRILLSITLIVFGVGFVGASHGAAAALESRDQQLLKELFDSKADQFECDKCGQIISKSALEGQDSPRCDICFGVGYYKPSYKPGDLTPGEQQLQELLYPSLRVRPQQFKCEGCNEVISRQDLVGQNDVRCGACYGNFKPYEGLEDWEFIEEDEKEGR